ncbi:hypothetical protein [Microcoleus sp. herbarium2]|uniref:hypothetical protein n=1 Tax=Microcoleus sp. herbarium2 TaxID=3055433 RepID=UPI002FD0D5DD
MSQLIQTLPAIRLSASREWDGGGMVVVGWWWWDSGEMARCAKWEKISSSFNI